MSKGNAQYVHGVTKWNNTHIQIQIQRPKTLPQCSSNFSLKWNHLQQFRLLTQPIGIARHFSWGHL